MEEAKDNKWEKANSKINEWMAKKIEDGSKKREIEEEREQRTKWQRQGGPQQGENTMQQKESNTGREP